MKILAERIPLFLLLLYTAVRLVLLTATGPLAGGFSHDSAYTALVARELLAGHGYVNPASWLTFLNPSELPVPFHNANPAFVTAVAGASWATGGDIFRSGFLISALSSVLLAAAVYWLVLLYAKNRWYACFCSAVTVLFPVHLADSFRFLPDGLFTALVVTTFVLVTREKFTLAGFILGLAWLTRSTASLCFLGIIVYLFRKYALRKAATVTVLIAAVTALTASPWLIRNSIVRGSPLKSDDAYYLLQNYLADKYDQGDVDRYWRSLDPPPTLGEILRSDGPALLWHTVRGIPLTVYFTLSGWSGAWKPGAIVMVLLLLAGFVWSSRLLLTPAGLGGLTVCACIFGVLAVRAQTLEIRYAGPATVLIFLFALTPLLSWFERRPPNLASLTTALPAGLLLLMVLPMQDRSIVRKLRDPNPSNAALRDVDEKVERDYAHGARVATHYPYFYSLFTDVSALSNPATDKARLLDYLNRYHAPFVLLEKNSKDYDIPALGPEIELREDLGTHVLLELRQK